METEARKTLEEAISELEAQAADPDRRQAALPRVGYRTVRDGGMARVEIDPAGTEIVRACFRLAGAGYPYRFILEFLNGQGLLPYDGLTLGISGVSRMLNDPYYCGFLFRRDGERVRTGSEPIVTQEEYARAQRRVAGRRYLPAGGGEFQGRTPA